MKKITKLFVFIFLFASVAQTDAKVRLGVKAGLNINNVSQNFSDSKLETKTKMRLGYHFGPVVDFGFSDAISLQTGLILSSKGFSMDLEDGLADGVTVDGYARNITNYIEIPILFTYKIKNFQLYAGPYVAIGIGGKGKWDYTTKGNGPDVSESGDTKLKPIFGPLQAGDIDVDEGYYNALDMGLNFGAGYKFGPVVANLGYSLGLGNRNNDLDGSIEYDPKDFKTSNRVITVSATFFFGSDD